MPTLSIVEALDKLEDCTPGPWVARSPERRLIDAVRDAFAQIQEACIFERDAS
jgi:hypothetical protein